MAGFSSEKWQVRAAALVFLGSICETCKGFLKKNLGNSIKQAATGIIDANPRVRYCGLAAMALLTSEMSPDVQKHFHQDIMPVLLKMMTEEEMIKMRT